MCYFSFLNSMFKSYLIVLGLIAAAAAIPLNQPVPDIVSDALMFNAFLGAWNPAAAVSYAKTNCGSGPGLCAEFASRAIAAGGAGNPVITWVPTLQSPTRYVRFSALQLPLRCVSCCVCRCAALQSAARVLTSLLSGLSTTAAQTSGQLAAVLPAPSSSTTPRPRAWTTPPSPWAVVLYRSTTPTAAGSSQQAPLAHHSHLLAFVVFFAFSVASICRASSCHAFALQHQRRVGHPPCLLQRLLKHRAMLRRCHFVTFSEVLPLLNSCRCADWAALWILNFEF
jgi:hypothetical protein